MQRWVTAVSASVLSLASVSAFALKPGERLDNFRLLDQQGASHELYYLSDMKAIVLAVQANDCDKSAGDLVKLSQQRDRYAQQGVPVLMLNPTRDVTRESVVRDM